MSVLFPSVYTQNTSCISDTLDDRCFDVVRAPSASAALTTLSVHTTQSRLYMRLFAHSIGCLCSIFIGRVSRNIWHVFTKFLDCCCCRRCKSFFLIPLLIAGSFHFMQCILMLAALRLKFRGSHDRNSWNAHMLDYGYYCTMYVYVFRCTNERSYVFKQKEKSFFKSDSILKFYWFASSNEV